jgi:hypothetical protein
LYFFFFFLFLILKRFLIFIYLLFLVTGDYDPDYKDAGVTYEIIQSVIEETLQESGYYDSHLHHGNSKVKGRIQAKENILPKT